MNTKFKIHKGDSVQVLAGKDKGKTGTVSRVVTAKDAVIVSGVNIVKKTIRRRSQQEQGGIAEVEAPIHVSNVALVCKKCGKPVKVGYKVVGDKKVRVCRKCGEAL